MYLLRTNKYVQPDEWEYTQNKPASSHLSFIFIVFHRQYLAGQP